LTDVSYLAAMRLLIADRQAFFPQLGSHNAHTVAAATVAAGSAPFEYQRLHGMGEALYHEVQGEAKLGRAVRIYAPVGGHEDLLAYLVRRLLENGANTSFVHDLADSDAPIAEVVRDPLADAEALRLAARASESASPIPPPRAIFMPERQAAAGLALYETATRASLHAGIAKSLAAAPYAAGPIVSGAARTGGDTARLVTCPHDLGQRIGTVVTAAAADIDAALAAASAAQHGWDRRGGPERARILGVAADLLERDEAALIGVIVREAGRTLEAAHAEVREAVDYLRYYAAEARRLFAGPVPLKGVTGERNTLDLRGRGVFAAISPWNFPVAIFTGQVAAALAAGNTVVAKPAEQTPIAAFLVTRLLHEAGVPADVLHLLPGDGVVGAALVKDRRVGGVAMTGSGETATAIARALLGRGGPLVPLIAETGGLNAMIADSSALPEQVVRDCVRSAFDSAGQRCSAARLLFLQEDIAATVIPMLTGAVAALDIGDPLDYATDVGPVIDVRAEDMLEGHKLRMKREAAELIDLKLPDDCRAGTYVTPAVYSLDSLEPLDREVFGPILHVVRFARGSLDKVVAALNATGYGLTLGLHSRIAATADYVAEHARVGNLYVNRNQIGAVVGSQPFGGEGLSGTGPKAGGPNTLLRYATERVRSDDITAAGGNIELIAAPAERAAATKPKG
jgi:RHH-type transcriptional regulator, proline utilization regulon repressor / proline dehydrogenase / delta 1-pyrroline-5-carboxylate dehydrogenase